MFLGLFIPKPTIELFGVGNFLPVGRDPRLDATAKVETLIVATITHPDGSVGRNVVLEPQIAAPGSQRRSRSASTRSKRASPTRFVHRAR